MGSPRSATNGQRVPRMDDPPATANPDTWGQGTYLPGFVPSDPSGGA